MLCVSISLTPYPGNLWFVRAIGCNVKCPTVPTIHFPSTGPRNLKLTVYVCMCVRGQFAILDKLEGTYFIESNHGSSILE